MSTVIDRLDDDRIERQAKGLRLLDAEFMTLLEIKDEAHIQRLAQRLTDDGVKYEYTFIAQANPSSSNHGAMHIGALYRKGVEVSDASLLAGSDLDTLGFIPRIDLRVTSASAEILARN